MKPPYKNAHTSREAELLTALKALEPYLDAIACYASTMDEHEPNRLIKQARAAIARVEHINVVDNKHAPVTPDTEISRAMNKNAIAHELLEISHGMLRIDGDRDWNNKSAMPVEAIIAIAQRLHSIGQEILGVPYLGTDGPKAPS